MRGWQWVLLLALVLSRTPAIGWREAFSKPRCDVAICKCRDCAGGANCCCAKARTPLEQVMAQSQCDRAEQEQLALTEMPRMAFAPEILAPAPRLVWATIELQAPQLLSRTIVPRSPPPR
ncbi:MAG: hypothetical protein CFK48_10685 [Armatimonadetes bacterium CP1_7O]|nr:MAG: hypothetical protein CFK48_10685 [Armatimonadetes bacterium CP1_7O]